MLLIRFINDYAATIWSTDAVQVWPVDQKSLKRNCEKLLASRKSPETIINFGREILKRRTTTSILLNYSEDKEEDVDSDRIDNEVRPPSSKITRIKVDENIHGNSFKTTNMIFFSI